MPTTQTKKAPGTQTLTSRAESLAARRDVLNREIKAEYLRPMPDTARLRQLKRARLRAKDEMALIRGLLRTTRSDAVATRVAA